ncbi:MAG: tRNA epoxyqueuosine(34) reductase QueG [Actinobacteria bacterium 13_1_20CM_3_68_9]|nr:MAG: tRNA epoxyqueuosine(34) reductase QueG [Actinobacteria bacterium 13_1_20CM_3_68_9]
MSLTDDLKRRAAELGFCAVGVTGAEPFVEAEAAAASRTQAGLMDGLSWWSEARVHASADPRRATPDARSVIALAFPHPRLDSSSGSPSPVVGESRGGGSHDGPRGRIAAYALGGDYHEVLLERMQPLLVMLREQGHVAKTYIDHGWMLDRAAAARAGIGWLGKNTNLLVPGIGSSVLLAEIVTSAELVKDQPLRKTCGGCDACMRVCPTGALTAPGVLDNRRCISFWTIEHRGVIPLEIRPLIGDWIFGCDLCQEICPVNVSPRVASPDAAALAAFGPTIDARPRLEELLALDEERFRTRFRGSAVWRTRRAGLLRNACIALGNTADRGSVPALARGLGDAEPLIRGHAAWALGRLGGAAARAQLDQAVRREDDAWVREECELALRQCGPLVVPSRA